MSNGNLNTKSVGYYPSSWDEWESRVKNSVESSPFCLDALNGPKYNIVMGYIPTNDRVSQTRYKHMMYQIFITDHPRDRERIIAFSNQISFNSTEKKYNQQIGSAIAAVKNKTKENIKKYVPKKRSKLEIRMKNEKARSKKKLTIILIDFLSDILEVDKKQLLNMNMNKLLQYAMDHYDKLPSSAQRKLMYHNMKYKQEFGSKQLIKDNLLSDDPATSNIGNSNSNNNNNKRTTVDNHHNNIAQLCCYKDIIDVDDDEFDKIVTGKESPLDADVSSVKANSNTLKSSTIIPRRQAHHHSNTITSDNNEIGLLLTKTNKQFNTKRIRIVASGVTISSSSYDDPCFSKEHDIVEAAENNNLQAHDDAVVADNSRKLSNSDNDVVTATIDHAVQEKKDVEQHAVQKPPYANKKNSLIVEDISDEILIIGSLEAPIDIDDILEEEQANERERERDSKITGSYLEQDDDDDDDDDVVQITGSTGKNALSDFPHSRFDCIVKPFTKDPTVFCSNCYCYVCDVKASECTKWNSSSSNNHCQAIRSDIKWRQRRSSARSKRKKPERMANQLSWDWNNNNNNECRATGNKRDSSRVTRSNITH